MRKELRSPSTFAGVLFAALLLGASASASVISVNSAFFAGSAVTTFSGLTTGTEGNGLTVNGIHLSYLVGGAPTNGQLVIDGGPGVTNNISPPNLVSVGNDAGTLLLTLPTSANAFGYGFANLSGATLASATTVMLLNGNTSVGSLTYAGSPDPSFSGGFAGIASTVQFNTVALTFDSTDAPAFALDNIVYKSTSAVPEPGTLILVASGIASGIAGRRRLRAG